MATTTEKGGYHCEFVEKPPEGVHSKCAVCKLVLCQPFKVSCCEKSFCQVCIERLKSNNKPCPTCKEENYDILHNKGLQHSLSELKVYCTHKQEGCEWKGELSQLDNHLKHCHIADNQTEHCPETVVDCEFQHVGCDVKLPRKDMPAHLNENLVTHMSLQATSYSKLLASHKELQTSHATLQASHIELQTTLEEKTNQSLVRKIDKQTTTDKITTSNGTAKHGDKVSLKDQLEHAQRESRQALTRMKYGLLVILTLMALALVSFVVLPSDKNDLQVQLLQDDLQQFQLLRETDKQTIQQIINHISLSTTTAEYYVEFTMDNFEQHKQDQDAWYSPSFYSHPQGYKLSLRVDASGYGSGEDTHLSVFAHVMTGEHDDNLKWPFIGRVIVQLVDQQEEREHYVKVIPYTDQTPAAMSGRVFSGGEMNEGWGFHEFVSQVELEKYYLKDDTLRFRVYRY